MKRIFILLALLSSSVIGCGKSLIEKWTGDEQEDITQIDALGSTNWYQGCYPTDVLMHSPKFPYFEISPVKFSESGVQIVKKYPLNKELDAFYPTHEFTIDSKGATRPFYLGSETGTVTYRTSNLLSLVDNSYDVTRAMDLMVYSNQLIIVKTTVPNRCVVNLESTNVEPFSKSKDLVKFSNEEGLHIVKKYESKSGVQFFALIYGAKDKEEVNALMEVANNSVEGFDKLWAEMKSIHSIAPFLTGSESQREINLTAAMVNRVIRNQRMGGQIKSPSAIEFYGPEWYNADCLWIWFQPATLHCLWIEPKFISNTLRNMLSHQKEDGFLSQITGQNHTSQSTQNPNISALITDYYRFTNDKEFLSEMYPKFQKWYQWWITNQTPDGNGIITIGREGMGLMEAIYEYGRDNSPESHGIMPLMDVPGVDGRPNRLYLPDIVACQARMAEDLSFMAAELGDMKASQEYRTEYLRVKSWVNENMWDEKTQWYYPIIRATGEKVMKRSCTAFWLLWAGVPDRERADLLIDGLFDANQFFTTLPVPQIALNDPSFNPNCKHWGDGNVWPIDLFHTFSGLLRYGEWSRAAKFANQCNSAIFESIKDTYQPNEFYNYKGEAEGCPIMGVAGNLPLTFKRYLKDYKNNTAPESWSVFAPKQITK